MFHSMVLAASCVFKHMCRHMYPKTCVKHSVQLSSQVVHKASRCFVALSGLHCSCRSGVRALPPRTQSGSLPLLGRLTLPTLNSLSSQPSDISQVPSQQETTSYQPTSGTSHSSFDDNTQQNRLSEDAKDTPVWVVTGLGSRGLVYHAWIGQQIARAAVTRDESHIRPELTAWQKLASDTKLVFESA